ncbi:MAG: CAP domain-containing protein [Acidimicrobiales bacterium]
MTAIRRHPAAVASILVFALAATGCGGRPAASPAATPTEDARVAVARDHRSVVAAPTTTTTTAPATTTTTAAPAPAPPVATVRRASAPVAAPPAPAVPDPTGEARALQLVNAERAQAGVPPLQLNTAARSVARTWSEHMAAGGLSHNPDLSGDLNRAGVTGWTTCGENVGYSEDVDGVHALFMASPGHRAHMLDPAFLQVGIGVVHAAGKTWVTMDLVAY